MARRPRLVVPGQPLHIWQRGNNRMDVFTDVADCTAYLRFMREASVYWRCAIHAYVVMTNHMHLLATPVDEHGPSGFMKSAELRYAFYFNKGNARTGTLWEGRFQSSPVDSERYFLTCSRYIELNPVRASMVSQPAEHRWSSFRCNAMGETDALIQPHPLYNALGSNAALRQEAYQRLFSQDLDAADLETIRRATKSGEPMSRMEKPDGDGE